MQFSRARLTTFLRVMFGAVFYWRWFQNVLGMVPPSRRACCRRRQRSRHSTIHRLVSCPHLWDASGLGEAKECTIHSSLIDSAWQELWKQQWRGPALQGTGVYTELIVVNICMENTTKSPSIRRIF